MRGAEDADEDAGRARWGRVDDAWGLSCQHYINCPYGIRRQVTMHHPVRDCVGEMLRCAYPA